MKNSRSTGQSLSLSRETLADLAPSEDLTQNVRGGASSAIAVIGVAVCALNVPGFSTGNGTFSAGGGCGAINPFYKFAWDNTVAPYSLGLEHRLPAGPLKSAFTSTYNTFVAPAGTLFEPYVD